MKGTAKTRREKIISAFTKKGYRITPQRLAIFDILAKSSGHPSVDMIYQQIRKDFPVTSLATVYKTIVAVKELGEVLELGFSDDSNRYDGLKPYPHPHLICNVCRKISDPDLESLEHLTDELTRESGFQIVHHRIDFFGICPDCQG